MNEEFIKEIIALKSVLNQVLSLYKLTHADQIEAAKEKALASGPRKKVYNLCDGKKGVTEIAKILRVKQPTVTHHLTTLSELGFITSETRKGKKYFFKLI
ncbi:winged helix-turn-helix transcriptional regulator [Patescibacteria group bacterium]|nr:winged helix-turn-helix transcriptional regulator [Patescibacteria group bacterium]